MNISFKQLITPPILFHLQRLRERLIFFPLSIFLIYLNSFPLILIFKAINSSPKVSASVWNEGNDFKNDFGWRKASDFNEQKIEIRHSRSTGWKKGKRGKESETRGDLERSKLNRYISVLRGQREKVRVVEVGYISEWVTLAVWDLVH